MYIVNQAINIYKKHLKTMLIMVLITTIPVFIFNKILPDFQSILQMARADSSSSVAVFLYFFVYVMCYGTFNVMLVSSLTYIAHMELNNKTNFIQNVYEIAIFRSPRYIITFFCNITTLYLSASFITISPILAMLLSLYFFTSFYYSIQYATLTNSWGFIALLKSRLVLKGFYLKTVAIICISYVPILALNYCAYYLIIFTNYNLFVELIITIFLNFVSSFFITANTAWFLKINQIKANLYYDLEKKHDV